MRWFSIFKQGRFHYMEFQRHERLERINRDFPLQRAYDSYTIKDRVWHQAIDRNTPKQNYEGHTFDGEGVNMPSIPLLEHYLGRYLTQDDFTLHSRNFLPSKLERYDRNHQEVLLDRLGGEDGQRQIMRRYLEEVDLESEEEDGEIYIASDGREIHYTSPNYWTTNIGNEMTRSKRVTAEINRFLEE